MKQAWRGAVAAALIAGVLVPVAILERRAHAPPRPTDARAAALPVEVSGCAAIVHGPLCEVKAGDELRLWLPGASTQGHLLVSTDRGALRATPTAWPDGLTLRVVVPDGAQVLRVAAEAHDGGGAPAASWSMPLRAPPTAAPAVDEAAALRGQGRLGEAAALLARAETEDAGTAARSAIVAALARVEFARGRIEEAVARFRQAIALHEAEGRGSEASDDAFALAFLLLGRNRFEEVRPVLSKAAELSRDYADARARGAYYEGLLARDTGDSRSALRATRRAEATAARLGMLRLRQMAVQIEAFELQGLGRHREALTAVKELYASDGARSSDCDRAELLDNVGWAGLLLAQSQPTATDAFDAREPIQEALALFRASCPDPNRIANVLVNLAMGELEHGRLSDAQRALDQARAGDSDPGVPIVLFWLHLSGRVALASGRAPDALRFFAREAELAQAAGTADDELLASEDRATALALAKREEEALSVLADADTLLDASGARIALGEGKETFFGAHDRSAALRVRILVDLGRDAEALVAARRSRARVLSGLRRSFALERLDPALRSRWEEAIGRYRRAREEVDAEAAHDWELPDDRLAATLAARKERAAGARATLEDALSILALPPEAPEVEGGPAPPGELSLLYFPGDRGWIGFARDQRGVSARRLGAIDPGAAPACLADELLRPFDDAIERARRVRLLSYGASRSIDVHALPWRGRALVDHVVVEYALDVPAPSGEGAAPRTALVVSDPAGDLPAARAEASAVMQAFSGAKGWQARSLEGEAAGGESVRAELARASLFHYAGHAAFGGPDGIDSALPLSDGARLTPGDVLALPQVPRWVTLFGCETGRESAAGALDSLGLANAFLVAGAHGVVAASRAVDDALARDVARELYTRLVATPQPDPAAALRDALAVTRARAPDADWAAFRALVP